MVKKQMKRRLFCKNRFILRVKLYSTRKNRFSGANSHLFV